MATKPTNEDRAKLAAVLDQMNAEELNLFLGFAYGVKAKREMDAANNQAA